MKKEQKIGTTKNKSDCHFLNSRCPYFLLLLFFLFINCANAEVATLRKSLIWSADNSSEYALAKNSEGIYSPDNFIATSGQITSLTVNWQASGKISFEVSADNGLHYYAVINGVPLKSGFISGDRLRWRAKILDEEAKLSLVNINYTDTAGVLGNFGEPALSGFLYRKAIFIGKSATQDLYNYQLKLKIGENESVKDVDVNLNEHSLANFKDIRFTAADGQTPLVYYFESVIASPQNAGLAMTGAIATFWVKVPQIPKEGVKIYIYYGNSLARDLSDPKNTFDFYDDFKNTELDVNSWVVKVDPKGSYAVKDGQLKLDAAEIIAKDFKFKQGIIEYAISVESGFENSLTLRAKTGESYDNPGLVVYSSAYKGAEHCIAIDDIVKANDAKAIPIAAGGKYNYRLIINNDDITFERMDQVSASAQAKVDYRGTSPVKAGYLGLKSGGDGNGKNIIYFGAIRARKAAATLPVIDNIGKEESVALPVFVDTQLSSSGSIALKGTAASGYYISADIAGAGEAARIIIPSWKLEPADKTMVNVSISADRGATYKKECANAKYYYVSKKDFSAGSSLKTRVDFSRQNIKEASKGLAEFSLDYRPGKITVISPGRGDSLNQATAKILWSATDYEPAYLMKLEYSLDRGKTYEAIADKINNDEKYLWSIPQDLLSKQAVIKVSDAYDNSIYAVSSGVFNIAAAGSKEEEALLSNSGTDLEEFLQKAAKSPDKKPYEILIKVTDNYSPDPAKDAYNYKAGDIVVIRPAGHGWSETEKNSFLILSANLSDEAVQELLKPRVINTGKISKDGKLITKDIGRRKFKIDLSKFDLKSKSYNKKTPPVRKYLREKLNLQEVLNEK